MYDAILLPTDGSASARRAASHGITLASLFDASIHILSVADIQRAAGPFDAGGIDEAFRERLEEDALQAIHEIERLASDRPDITTTVKKGDPATDILSYTERHDIDLIAMGNQGRTGVHRYIAGSVTERVARLSPVPVLTSRDTEQSKQITSFDEILVPTDGSAAAAEVIPHAVEIASRTGARIHAVSVLNFGDLVAGDSYQMPSDLQDHVKQRAVEAAEQVEQKATEAGIEVTTSVPTGRPSRVLLEYVDEHGIDLVTIGTHGHSGIQRVLLGSTTERIMRHATIPVLSVSTRA